MKTFLKRFAVAVGGLLLLWLLVHLVENWRGKRAWQQWKQSRIEAGDHYDPGAYAPPPVPDAENFARAPGIVESVMPNTHGPVPPLPGLPGGESVSKTLTNWRLGQKADLTGLTADSRQPKAAEIMKPWDNALRLFGEAAQRPHCRLVEDYSQSKEFIHPLLGMRTRSRALSLRAILLLREKRPDRALEDVLTGLRVVKHFQREPDLISQLLRIATANVILQPIWEGLADHQWNEAQLARLQGALSEVDLIQGLKLGWQFERLGMVQGFEQMAADPLSLSPSLLTDGPNPGRLSRLASGFLLPRGWVYQNLRRLDQFQVKQFLDGLDADHHRVNVRAIQASTEAFLAGRRTPYTFLFRITMPALAGQNLRMARSQSGLDQAIVACALERHWLAKGHYPERLEELVPAYLPKVPGDVIEGLPLRYAATDRTHFRLYSVGWNLKDEGGLVADRTPDSAAKPEEGDWVWSSGH